MARLDLEWSDVVEIRAILERRAPFDVAVGDLFVTFYHEFGAPNVIAPRGRFLFALPDRAIETILRAFDDAIDVDHRPGLQPLRDRVAASIGASV